MYVLKSYKFNSKKSAAMNEASAESVVKEAPAVIAILPVAVSTEKVILLTLTLCDILTVNFYCLI